MSDMKKLLESMTKFAGEPDQKPGDQVRGHERATKQNPFKGRLVGGANESKEAYCDACDRVESKCVCDKDLAESLMQEYKYFVKEADPTPAPGQPASPVANINPAGTGTAATQTPPAGQPAAAGTAPANTATTAAPAKPGTPAPGTAAPAAGTTPPKPGTPAPTATTPPKPGTPAPAKPGAPAAGGQAAGTATPPNPQQVKQQTDALSKVLNNPAHPMNAELQALVKKAGSIPS